MKQKKQYTKTLCPNENRYHNSNQQLLTEYSFLNNDLVFKTLYCLDPNCKNFIKIINASENIKYPFALNNLSISAKWMKILENKVLELQENNLLDIQNMNQYWFTNNSTIYNKH